MTAFILAALALVAAVLALLLRPLLRARQAATADERREANLRIFRDQLAELERERDEGSLAAADFGEARRELQRRLLDELAPGTGPEPAAARPGGRKTALALLVLLPLAAASGYALLGTPQAISPPPAQAEHAEPEIDAMLGKLRARLKENPDNPQGWAMLARSYRVLGRFAEAAEAYGHAGALVDGDPALLADYAEALARAGGSFAGKPEALIGRALKLDADAPHALFLAGLAARERKDFSAAVEHWGRLLRQLDPGSEEAHSIESALDNVRAMATPSKPAGD